MLSYITIAPAKSIHNQCDLAGAIVIYDIAFSFNCCIIYVI